MMYVTHVHAFLSASAVLEFLNLIISFSFFLPSLFFLTFDFELILEGQKICKKKTSIESSCISFAQFLLMLIPYNTLNYRSYANFNSLPFNVLFLF